MSNAEDIPEGPAEKLVGQVLLNRWTVIERLERDDGDTGQSRSCCYKAVAEDGTYAFIKAFDFRYEDAHGTTDRLENMLREFNNERRVHEHCKEKRLSRVTTIKDFSKVVVDGDPVNVLICEYAEGSLRKLQPPGCPNVTSYARLYGLRQVASALAQLHAVGVAHQDVKPSNAVHFKDFLKITDLGSSSCMSLPVPPHDEQSYAGQPNYAPYELLYNESGTWYRRRIGCDLFLLGNLIFTSFVGHSLSFLVLHGIDDSLRHTTFTGKYEEVLPDLISNHHVVVEEFLRACAPPCVADQLIEMVISMCHPDPAQRGHPKNLLYNGDQYGLHRYVSKLDALARKAQLYDRSQAA